MMISELPYLIICPFLIPLKYFKIKRRRRVLVIYRLPGLQQSVHLAARQSTAFFKFWFCVIRQKKKPLPVFSSASCKCVTISALLSLKFPTTDYFVRIHTKTSTLPVSSVCKRGDICLDTITMVPTVYHYTTIPNTSNNHSRVIFDNKTYCEGVSDTHLLLKATAMVSIAFSKSILSASLQASQWKPEKSQPCMCHTPAHPLHQTACTCEDYLKDAYKDFSAQLTDL